MDLLLRRLALAVALAFGLAGAQGPEYLQQYRQRLAGAVDELARNVATFQVEAAAQNLTPDAAVVRLEANSDPVAQARGRDAADDRARLNRLRDGLDALASEAPLRRLGGFVSTFDASTARRAWGDFQPAVPTTLEAAFYAGGAALLGWAATHLLVAPARRRFARRGAGVAG